MQPKIAPVSRADYLAREAKSARKHEYVDGEIYAMAGASRRHNLLVANLMGRAWNVAQQSGRCQVFGPDMKHCRPGPDARDIAIGDLNASVTGDELTQPVTQPHGRALQHLDHRVVVQRP